MSSILSQQILASIKAVCGDHQEITLHEPEISQREKELVLACLDSGWISTAGKYIGQFESSLTEFTQAKHAIATVNGTSALHICLLLAGVKKNDEVLVPTLTFVATANAICYTQAIPHFVDVEEQNLGVDVEKLRKYLHHIGEFKNKHLYNKQTGRKISSLIVVHTFGHPCQMNKLVSLCEEFDLFLIEDAAESLGSFYQNKHTGTFGKLSALSFNGNKIISSGGGGAILTNDKELAQKAKHLTTTAKIADTIASEHDSVAYNYRLPNLNAALGVAQIQNIKEKIEKKRQLALRYQQVFSSFEALDIFVEKEHCCSNYWLNLLILKQASLKIRDEIIRSCIQEKVFVRPVWGLMHQQKMFLHHPRMEQLDTASSLFKRVICLPSSPQLIQNV